MRIMVCEPVQLSGNDQHRMDNAIPDKLLQAAQSACELIRDAGSADADLVCFPQWFVGFGNIAGFPNEITGLLQQAAQDSGVVVAIGTFRAPGSGMKSRQCSLLLDTTGEIVLVQQKRNLYPLERQWQLASEEIRCAQTAVGRVVISHGDDAADPVVYERVRALQPDVWVVQTNDMIDVPKWTGHQIGFRDLVAQRAQEMTAPLACPMLKGEFMHVTYSGGSFLACPDGRIHSLDPATNALIVDV